MVNNQPVSSALGIADEQSWGMKLFKDEELQSLAVCN